MIKSTIRRRNATLAILSQAVQ